MREAVGRVRQRHALLHVLAEEARRSSGGSGAAIVASARGMEEHPSRSAGDAEPIRNDESRGPAMEAIIEAGLDEPGCTRRP